MCISKHAFNDMILLYNLGQNRFKADWEAEGRSGHKARNSCWVCRWTRSDGSYLHGGTVGVCMRGWRWECGAKRLSRVWSEDTRDTFLLSQGASVRLKVAISLPLSIPPLLIFLHHTVLVNSPRTPLLPLRHSLPCQRVVTSLNGKSIYFLLPPPLRHTQDLWWLLQILHTHTPPRQLCHQHNISKRTLPTKYTSRIFQIFRWISISPRKTSDRLRLTPSVCVCVCVSVT